MARRLDEEDRRQQRLWRLGTQNPFCRECGESDPAVLDQHHPAGRKHSPDVVTVCANCHRKLSDKQLDRLRLGAMKKPRGSEAAGHYVLGVAELLQLNVEDLRKLGNRMLQDARRKDSRRKGRRDK